MISVQNVSKLYRIYERPSDRLKEMLLRGRRRYHRDFWALEGINLEVKTGETVGVVGRNGAGKTTLLQIIAGILKPTTGDVCVEGRVTALLELGSGFNPEYTGRENILLSGQILGFSEAEMQRRLEVIVQFAELEAFLDQPVKTYSTGMLMRLAFAAAIHVDPDVLIVDEALSVGDVSFQRKSLDRMEYFRRSGKTVLFVSHDPRLVQRFCDRALWLESGRAMMCGPAQQVATSYEAFCQRLESEWLETVARSGRLHSQAHEEILRELRLAGSRWGNGRIRFTHVEMLNAAGEPSWVFRHGEPATIRLHFTADQDYDRPVFAVDIHRYDGVFIGTINNHDTHPAPLSIKRGEGSLELRIPRLELPLNVYYLSLKAYTESGAPHWDDPADIHNQMYQFDVVTDRVIHGLVQFEAEWCSAKSESPTRVATP
jgi:ABC-type polysaccharide/polyol phosphate transport system ATPase subunit